VVLAPPAKLNLWLDVLFRRDDGFHELETVMHAIDLTDRLSVRRVSGREVTLNIGGRECPGGDDNLVVRAAEAYFSGVSSVQDRFGIEADLQKNIPLGAGLGGGSADAAGMLVALDQLASHPVGPDSLAAMGASLGSDVPFFVRCGDGGTAVATGRGEKIRPLEASDSPRWTFVLLYPGVKAETASVYGRLNRGLTRPKKDLKTFLKMVADGGSVGVPEFHNSLAEPFRDMFPDLAALHDLAAERAGRPLTVTGSGSAMFTVVADRDEGELLADELRTLPFEVATVCESLPARPEQRGGHQ